MVKYGATIDRDGNRVPITTSDAFKTSKTVAFTGAAGLGAQGTVSLFTVTGDVLVRVFGVVTESLAGATATIEVGVAGNTAAIIAQVLGTNLAANDVLVSGSSPVSVASIATAPLIVGGGADIIATVATADITDGTITFYCTWRPLSSTGNVVAA